MFRALFFLLSILLLILLPTLEISESVANAQYTSSGGAFYAVSSIAIASPLNTTYEK